jgi:hypothetical protein
MLVARSLLGLSSEAALVAGNAVVALWFQAGALGAVQGFLESASCVADVIVFQVLPRLDLFWALAFGASRCTVTSRYYSHVSLRVRSGLRRAVCGSRSMERIQTFCR